MKTEDIQRALRARGFDPGPIDGIWGRQSIGAAKAFQAANGLFVDGIVGPLTVAKLNAAPAVPGTRPVMLTGAITPPWFVEAGRHMGLREVKGRGTSGIIAGWLKALRAPWSDDETPWCGTYVGHCVAAALPDEALPDNPFAARAWLGFGVPLTAPAPGVVAVFWRGKRSGWSGHVGFYAGERRSDRAILVRGGNQSDAVTETYLARDRLLGWRWPRTYPLPATGAVHVTAAGGLSRNEA